MCIDGKYKTYSEIIINRVVLIFADFMVHANHGKKKQMKYKFPFIVACTFETTNSTTHGSIHFIETTNSTTHGLIHFIETTQIGVNE
jgi:hypothetical protein